jgi:hypothetical protein
MRLPVALSTCSACVALVLAGASPLSAAPPAFADPVVAGELGAPPKNEASGLAASRRQPDVLWLHDDSGGKAMLYAVDTKGALRGTLQIGGVKNEDWEDLAATELYGQAWLVVGDIGDNQAVRPHVLVHFVAEPTAERLAVAGKLAERPKASLQIRFEDGPRDCESLAVDARERTLYLLSKRDPTPRLYRVALPSPLASTEVIARFAGPVPHLPPPSFLQGAFAGAFGKRFAFPCGMDFAADGSAAIILTYGDVLYFARMPGESWAEALARPPLALAPHGLPQAEAICFSRDGRQIFVASENSRKLLRYDQR